MLLTLVLWLAALLAGSAVYWIWYVRWARLACGLWPTHHRWLGLPVRSGIPSDCRPLAAASCTSEQSFESRHSEGTRLILHRLRRRERDLAPCADERAPLRPRARAVQTLSARMCPAHILMLTMENAESRLDSSAQSADHI